MKTAIVTGASRGIGAASAKALAQEGYAVAVNYSKDENGANQIVNEIISSGGTAYAIKADVSKPSDVKQLFETTADKLGQIEVLVNNAGISHIGLLQDMSDNEICSLTDIDFMGSIYCSREAIKAMLPRHYGCIINIASMWGEVGASCESVYSACKAGVIGLTKALAKEVGPCGIRVNCVSPGVIDTKMNSSLESDVIKELCNETPLLRIGTPDDIANVITFLASDKSSFITGQIIPVNGGII